MQNKPKVTLITHTPDPEKIISTAARLCYSPSEISAIMENFTEDKMDKFINLLLDLGHESPFEHVTFTFGIEGASRITEQQLTRHRLASYSIQSGRYVTRDNATFVMPPSIQPGTKEYEIFTMASDNSRQAYNDILKALKEHYLFIGMKDSDAEKKAAEDARYILPGSLATRIIFSMNIRSLWNFFHHRCCNRAQWEIRHIAREVLKLCKQASPALFKHAGAHCATGICPENSMQCNELRGKIITLKQVQDYIATYNK